MGGWKGTILIIFTLIFTIDLQAQVACYPLNGNTKDESGNGGTVNGAILITERFGYANSAYNFDGVDDWIS